MTARDRTVAPMAFSARTSPQLTGPPPISQDARPTIWSSMPSEPGRPSSSEDDLLDVDSATPTTVRLGPSWTVSSEPMANPLPDSVSLTVTSSAAAGQRPDVNRNRPSANGELMSTSVTSVGTTPRSVSSWV